jgi:hypothetical protein
MFLEIRNALFKLSDMLNHLVQTIFKILLNHDTDRLNNGTKYLFKSIDGCCVFYNMFYFNFQYYYTWAGHETKMKEGMGAFKILRGI